MKQKEQMSNQINDLYYSGLLGMLSFKLPVHTIESS